MRIQRRTRVRGRRERESETRGNHDCCWDGIEPPSLREEPLHESRSARQILQNFVLSDWEEEEMKHSSASVPLNGACGGTHEHDSGSGPL